MDNVILSPSDFVALVNQTLEFAFPYISIEGELSNFRVSKNKWVYFDLKDDNSSVKCFGTIYQLPGPLEDGMMLKVSGNPRLHALYGFSLTVQSITPSGEGSIKKAANLLQEKLTKEGLFDQARKRQLPYPPTAVGLIASDESAAYSDFIKVVSSRWNVKIIHKNVQVQGESAVGQIVSAINEMNSMPTDQLPEVLVLTRGGGSADDLLAFSSEQVTRAVASSRIPTIVAIGHERDVSLAELAADVRASTPSNAAELLVPDRQEQLVRLDQDSKNISRNLKESLKSWNQSLDAEKQDLTDISDRILKQNRSYLEQAESIFRAYSPQNILDRGYAIIRSNDKVISSTKQIAINQSLDIQVSDGTFSADVSKGV